MSYYMVLFVTDFYDSDINIFIPLTEKELQKCSKNKKYTYYQCCGHGGEMLSGLKFIDSIGPIKDDNIIERMRRSYGHIINSIN